ncbi:hypothetical protein CS0771_71910 [Catellatospora sp. IY07-71]|uniref:DNA alkylation repair protein n=1 Tax=Catellatospora sp. IY07-71 TaxID=2728827 RepID=UPI001BB329C5|nr:DNA alkylation repair protein [Catellatospora sp. IY07-71]BCJ77647.1 hypothetical protein CS0771_71910 [Catellatospora sp. IY07-71]
MIRSIPSTLGGNRRPICRRWHGRGSTRDRAAGLALTEALAARLTAAADSALLHQLTYQADTDAERLLRYCADLAPHPDFFIRKAVGWALREYAKTDPAAVRGFVAAHPELSGLSRREALKHLS